MPQIDIRRVTRVYSTGGVEIRAVDGISLTIDKGEFISIIGHSGSGKTTLLSVIGGLIRLNSGTVLFEGTDIFGLDDRSLSEYRAEKVGYIFQFASLIPVLTAKENLLLPTLFRPQGSPDGQEKACEYLEMVGLKDRMDALPSQLSGGQQRRVAIARSLMNDPEVILADEPTGDLDEETEWEIMELLRGIRRAKGITVVLVTHNSALAGDATRKLRMTQGQIHDNETCAISPCI